MTRKKFDRAIRDKSISDGEFYMLILPYIKETERKLSKIESKLINMKSEWKYRSKLIKKTRPITLDLLLQDIV